MDNYKLSRMSDASWKKLSELFMHKIAQSDLYEKMVKEFLNFMSEHDIKLHKIDHLIDYHLRRLDGTMLLGDLAQSADTSIVKDRLNFVRFYSARYSQRTLNYKSFCTGWTDNLHMELSKDIFDERILFVVGNSEHVLFKLDDSDHLFVSDEYEIDLEPDGQYALIYSRTSDILYEFDVKIGCLRRILITDEIVLDVVCDKSGRISEISQLLSQNRLRFSYSPGSGCLTTILKQTDNDGGYTETIFYNYDSSNRLAAVSSSAGFVHNISYYSDGNLQEIKSNTLRMRYEYDYNTSNGLLLSRMQSWNVKSGVALIDQKYEFDDNGWIRIVDVLDNTSLSVLFDTKHRIVGLNKNENAIVSNIKIDSNVLYTRLSMSINGQLVQTRLLDEKNSKLTLANQQGGELRIREQKLNKTHKSIEYADSIGNRMNLLSVDMLAEANMASDIFTYANGLKETRLINTTANEMQTTRGDGSQLLTRFDNQKRRVYYSHATGDAKKGCSYKYYGETSLIQTAANVDPLDSIHIEYDEKKRVARVNSANGFSIKYSYDDRDQIREVRSTDDRYHVLYEYEATDGRLSGIIDKKTGNNLFNIAYPDSNTVQIISKERGKPRINEFKLDLKTNLIKSYTTNLLDTQDERVTYEYEYNNRMQNTKISKRFQSQNGKLFSSMSI
jgi:YD repeat-containing protein